MKPNFIIAVTGQSNSQGHGGHYEIGKTEDQPHERVMGWNAREKKWVVATLTDESLGTVDHRIPGSQSFAFHFAKQIAKNDPTKIVGIVNYGIGGQPIKRWTKVPSQAFFRIIPNGWKSDQTVLSLKACNDRIICLDQLKQYHASRPVNINYGWEAFSIVDAVTKKTFTLENVPEGKALIKSAFHNSYISIGQGGIVSPSVVETDECIFDVEMVRTGYTRMYAFKGKNGYLCLNSLGHVDGPMLGVDVNATCLVGVSAENEETDTPHGDIYAVHAQRIKESLKEAKLRKIDCICWHQGEADFACYGTYYENAICQTIDQYRKENFCNNDTVFIVGNTSKVPDSDVDWWKVRNTQLSKLNVDYMVNTACVDTVGVDYNILDKIHFSSEGHRQLGNLYCEKFLKMKKLIS